MPINSKFDDALRFLVFGYFDTIEEFLHDTLDFPPFQLSNNAPAADDKYFNPYVGVELIQNFWPQVTAILTLYVVFVFFGPRYMRGRPKSLNKSVLLAWNVFLAVFSITGFCMVIPVALFHPEAGMLTAGIHRSVCTNAGWYGQGLPGMFVWLFIVSKLFELIDTVFLVLGKRPVILLHWYHHVSVTLFCWHSYSQWIPTGVWFAVVNYGVHSVMYSYYACTQLGPAWKRRVRILAPYITLVQLSQMLFGLLIIGSNIYFSSFDDECFTRKANNVWGLLMYFSYFVLFAEMGLKRFCCARKRKPRMKRKKA